MKKFKLSALVAISVYTEVEAETLEQAVEIAKERPMMSIITNNGDSEQVAWMADELDGEPQNIHED